MFMASSRSPDINYNGSGYFDETARNAIINADRKQLTERRKRVINKFYEIEAAEGFRIDSYIKLSEIGDEEMYKDCFARTERCSILKKMICKNNDCPFYKSKKQHEEDIKKYPQFNHIQKESDEDDMCDKQKS